jgi:hypothetical protein
MREWKGRTGANVFSYPEFNGINLHRKNTILGVCSYHPVSFLIKVQNTRTKYSATPRYLLHL